MTQDRTDADYSLAEFVLFCSLLTIVFVTAQIIPYYKRTLNLIVCRYGNIYFIYMINKILKAAKIKGLTQ